MLRGQSILPLSTYKNNCDTYILSLITPPQADLPACHVRAANKYRNIKNEILPPRENFT